MPKHIWKNINTHIHVCIHIHLHIYIQRGLSANTWSNNRMAVHRVAPHWDKDTETDRIGGKSGLNRLAGHCLLSFKARIVLYITIKLYPVLYPTWPRRYINRKLCSINHRLLKFPLRGLFITIEVQFLHQKVKISFEPRFGPFSLRCSGVWYKCETSINSENGVDTWWKRYKYIGDALNIHTHIIYVLFHKSLLFLW